ncbi:MAG: hypothetical protein VW840_17145, partial [Gammaproteobacteria bacterium]
DDDTFLNVEKGCLFLLTAVWEQGLFDDMGATPEARLDRAAFRIEIEKCEKCGGKVKVIACVVELCLFW